jgi:uncharacterized protein (TIGR02246 family)
MSASVHMLEHPAESPANDEAAVRDVVARTAAAWADGDGEAYAACFCEDCDYTTFSGLHLHGRKQNADLHSALFRRSLKGTTIDARIEAVELLADDVALVRTSSSGQASGRQSYVLVKRDGAWVIRSFQNTRVQPAAAWITRWLQGLAPVFRD